MNTCETCRYWTNVNCRGAPDSEWAYCEMAEYTNDEHGNRHPESLAIAQDKENYSADLRTHRTFGCNQHQPK